MSANTKMTNTVLMPPSCFRNTASSRLSVAAPHLNVPSQSVRTAEARFKLAVELNLLPCVPAVWPAFFARLRQLGHTEGKNLIVDRYRGEDASRYAEIARKVVEAKPGVTWFP